jgi:hypothetical protein
MRNKRWERRALMLVLAASICGCARNKNTAPFRQTRDFVATADDFGMLLLRAGLEPEEIPTGKELTLEQAHELRLWLRFRLADGYMPAYGPRILASFLLEEALKTGKDVPRRALTDQLNRHGQLVVLRPDGYLVKAVTGSPLRCAGPLRMLEGAPRAGAYKMDAFYVPEGDAFREDTRIAAPAIFMPEAGGPTERVVDDKAH